MARQWMPMFWGDYSRKTQHLSTVEHGAYLLLIAHYWNTGQPLPDNDDILRRITRTTTKQWKAMSPAIRAFFNKSGDNLHHERVDDELRKTLGVSTLQSSRAKEGWKTKKNQQPDDASGNHAAMQTKTTPLSDKNSNTLTSSNNKHPLTPSKGAAKAAGVVLEVVWKGIDACLSDAHREAAKRAAPGWDMYHLMNVYDQGVATRGIPRIPAAAFIAWCANYTKGKSPS